jgi:diketogulonate reductase-like aldo/keto reductase
VTVIPKSEHPGRIALNLDLFGFTLDPEDIVLIDELHRR